MYTGSRRKKPGVSLETSSFCPFSYLLSPVLMSLQGICDRKNLPSSSLFLRSLNHGPRVTHEPRHTLSMSVFRTSVPPVSLVPPPPPKFHTGCTMNMSSDLSLPLLPIPTHHPPSSTLFSIPCVSPILLQFSDPVLPRSGFG